jgi:alkylation response protein AidB-like acyl-CoA dehydrogenase
VDLEYGERYERLRAELREFLGGWPLAGAEAALPAPEQEALFRRRGVERGYVYREFPKRYGGSEQPADPLADAIIREEYWRAGAPGDILLQGPSLLAPTLLACGSEEQRERFIPPTLRGEIVWCQGYSEPGAGSDLASLSSRAVLEGDRFVIHGHKIWTSRAHQAEWMFGLFRTEPDAPKHAGISYLLIPMRQPGISVRPLRQLTGGVEFNEVFFDGAVTAAENVVGRRGEGWQVSRATLKHERNSIGAAAQTNALFQGLVHLAKTTRRGGKPAIEDATVRDRLVAIEGYVRAHEYSSYVQLTRDARGEDPGILQLMSKLNSTNIGSEVAKLALEILGDDGLLDPTVQDEMVYLPNANRSWITQYMYSLGIAIAGGSANVQRNVIAERGLGLPRDWWAQRSAGR